MTVMRKEAGLSQVRLAERLDLGQSFVSKIERGETYIELTLFIDWCQACGVEPGVALDALLARQSEPVRKSLSPTTPAS
ncbi:MAG: helix-turn-helix domain-containing protein [Desulfovibrionaceae bacterium]|nr:helix-turn-helix domain-containing protein [Desulfovibrionaceae bacterium]